MYFLATNQLRPGEVPRDFKEVIARHIAWITDGIKAGIILQAGKWGKSRGMCLIKADSLAQAETIIRQDPLIASGAVEFLIDEYFSNVPLE